MKLYGGIDLHSNNCVVTLIDEQDRVSYQKRLPNDLDYILLQLSPYQSTIEGLAVESTFNWYWLVDGLMAAGYTVHLVNTAAVTQYEGLKYTDDHHDARHLAHLLRLGILPTGYIYPRETRPVRDLLRKRAQLVRHRTTHLLSIQGLLMRHGGRSMSGHRIKQLAETDIETLFPEVALALAAKSSVAVLRTLDGEIKCLEQAVKCRARLKPEFRSLLTVAGIGQILGLTIVLETGEIGRFAKVGHFASYCRCVESKRLSNSKKKGEANAKCGNKYLAWAFVEAANFAVRYHPQIKRFYQRKAAKTKKVVAIKAVAHKLARACYYIMRDRVAFDVNKAFS